MKIEITEQEYRDLLDILHIADVAMTGHRRGADSRTERHRALIQKLYALAANEGFEGMFAFNAGVQKYVPSADFERGTLAHVVLEEFGDHLFWDELINRLSLRDAAQMAGGMDRLNTMNPTDRQRMEGPIRERYVQEFSTYDVTNLEVVQRFDGRWGAPVKTSD